MGITGRVTMALPARNDRTAVAAKTAPGQLRTVTVQRDPLVIGHEQGGVSLYFHSGMRWRPPTNGGVTQAARRPTGGGSP